MGLVDTTSPIGFYQSSPPDGLLAAGDVCLLQLLLQLGEHIDRHRAEVILRLPVPLGTGAAVVELIGPALCDTLLERIHIIDHLEVGLVLLDLSIDRLRSKAHGSDVETVVVDQTAGISLHQLDASVQCVGHIHHIHQRALGNRADELLTTHSAIVDINRVVGRTTTRRRHIGDETREAYRTGVNTILRVEPVAEQLGSHLAHTIDGLRTLYRVLRGVNLRRVGAERTDATRRKHLTLVVLGHLEDVPKTIDTNLPSQLGLVLSHH